MPLPLGEVAERSEDGEGIPLFPPRRVRVCRPAFAELRIITLMEVFDNAYPREYTDYIMLTY